MTFNLLLSYAVAGTIDLERIRRSMPCGRLMIDSGAFTAWTTGKPIDLDAYADYLQGWRGCWDHAITLDVIGDPVASRRNTRKLHERGLPVMPVFTRGNSLADLDAMLADVPFICAGGLVKMPEKHRVPRIRMLQRRAAERGGGIHALGVGSLPALRASRPYSADTSRFLLGYGYHSVQIFDGRDLHSIDILDRVKMARHRADLVAHGFSVSERITQGRMPEGNKPGMPRWLNSQALGVAAACADEYLKATYPVPIDGPLPDGPHFYAVAMATDAYAVATTDERLHSADAPPIWGRYAMHHHCSRKVAA